MAAGEAVAVAAPTADASASAGTHDVSAAMPLLVGLTGNWSEEMGASDWPGCALIQLMIKRASVATT